MIEVYRVVEKASVKVEVAALCYISSRVVWSFVHFGGVIGN